MKAKGPVTSIPSASTLLALVLAVITVVCVVVCVALYFISPTPIVQLLKLTTVAGAIVCGGAAIVVVGLRTLARASLSR